MTTPDEPTTCEELALRLDKASEDADRKAHYPDDLPNPDPEAVEEGLRSDGAAEAYADAAEMVRELDPHYERAVNTLSALEEHMRFVESSELRARAQLDSFIDVLKAAEIPPGNMYRYAFPNDDTERPPCLDRQGVRGHYGARLADRLDAWLDTLDASDAEMVVGALHRDMDDMEER